MITFDASLMSKYTRSGDWEPIKKLKLSGFYELNYTGYKIFFKSLVWNSKDVDAIHRLKVENHDFYSQVWHVYLISAYFEDTNDVNFFW